MRLDKIDLNLFTVFDAIYREASVTQVAHQLHLTQPAVSNALNRLRQTFDDQLFVRTPEGMLPTPVADNIIGDVRKALFLLGKSVGANAKFDPANSEKRFRLGMNDLVQLLLLPALLEKLGSAAPGITATAYYLDRQIATEELKSGELDLLLDTTMINAKEFDQVPLLKLPYVVAMRKANPLAKKPLTLASYVSAKHIHVSSRKKGRGQPDIALHGIGQKRSVALRIQNYLIAEEVTAKTNLLWTVPKVLAERSNLFFTDVPLEVEPLKFNLYWSKSAGDDPANRWMRERIIDIARN